MARAAVTSSVARDLSGLIGEAKVYSNERVRQTFSKDAYHFSPLLEEALKAKVADVVVAPGGKEELHAVVSYAVREGLPLTVRGAGTGNYGQCVPLQGGIVVLMRSLNRILNIDPEGKTVRLEPSVLIGKLEGEARAHGLEVRCYPSTWTNATVAGFIGGGFGGVGSIRHGTIWDGYLLGAEVLTAEDPARFLRTESVPELLGVIHAYGVSGIMTELTVGLAEAVPWQELALSFADLEAALRFGYALSSETSIDKRLVSIVEAPIPGFFKPLAHQLTLPSGRALAMLELRAGQLEDAQALARGYGGRLAWWREPEGYHASAFNLSDFTWNHTTHWARKADEGLTYLQALHGSDFEGTLSDLRELKSGYGDELLMHLEFMRMGGDLTLAGLPLLRFRSREQVYEIIAHYERLGVQIADPHSYYLDADSRWNGQHVLSAKARWDPKGLLNPGKLSQESRARSQEPEVSNQ